MMFRSATLALTLALSALGPASVHAQRPTGSFASQPEAIAFDLFRGTRIFFDGTINGRPARMMLDSGASSTVLNRNYARSIGVAEGRQTQVRGAGGTAPGWIGRGVTMRAGGLTVANADVLILEIDDIAQRIGQPIDVILGMETFRAGIVDIDFAARKLSFRPRSGFAPPPGAIAVKITEAGGRRTIPISLNGGPPVAADLDLGHGGSLLIARREWQGDPQIRALRSAPATAGGVGGRVAKRAVTLPFVTLAGQRFDQVPALLNEGANDLPVNGANVGIDLLQRFRLIFDYSRHLLYLAPDRARLAEPIPKSRLGLRLELAGDRLKVAEVTPGSPGEAAGWRVGDEVIAVNGIRVDARYWFRPDVHFATMKAGTSIDLVRADGAKMPVVLRDYF